jgi:predicted metalloprotease with PDZ domain
LLVNLRLRDATRSKASLKDVMLEISQNAQQRGLTPEILQSMLDE